jgi:hypothetical protein
MRWRIGFAALALTVLLVGCGEDPQAMLETAQLEEKQNNPEHARELYERIVRDHPDTPAATAAKERLQALGAAP